MIERRKSYGYGIHNTETDPETIKNEGFHASSGGYTLVMEPEIRALYRKYLPANPCFISNPHFGVEFLEQYRTKKYSIDIDISGLTLYPDFNNVIEQGAFYDMDADTGELYFWWYDRSINVMANHKLRDYLQGNGGMIFPEEFTGDMSWELLGTAAINGDAVTPERIAGYSKKAGANEIVRLAK